MDTIKLGDPATISNRKTPEQVKTLTYLPIPVVFNNIILRQLYNATEERKGSPSMSDRFDQIQLPSQGDVTIDLDGSRGNIYVGGQGAQGDISLRDADGNETVHIDGGGGNLTMGGGGHEGDIALQDAQGNQSIHIDGGGGNLTMGGEGHNADIRLLNANGDLVIHLDAGAGEVLVRGQSLQPADFVFTADYVLPSLGDVRSFISRHGHLPSLHSGREMKETGINLGEFTMKLLQKVEELTLYLIKQDDVIHQQQRRIEQVEKRIQR
ncbi:MAG: hypothetical protein ACRDS9_01855 [Pseudonocardiaceae bacterium]